MRQHLLGIELDIHRSHSLGDLAVAIDLAVTLANLVNGGNQLGV